MIQKDYLRNSDQTFHSSLRHPKHDANFTAAVAKIVETLRNLLNNDPTKLTQHILINYKSVDEYLLNNWHWNEGRYGTQRGLRDMADVLVKARVLNFLPLPDAI